MQRDPPLSQLEITAFESERLAFVPTVAEHAQVTYPLLADESLYLWMPGNPLDLPSLKERYAFWESRRSPDGKEWWWNWIINLKATSGIPGPPTCVGTLQVGIDKASHVATLAYIIGSQYQRHGYATEALNALLNLLRLKGIHQVMAWVDTRNIPSIGLLKKLKFTSIDRIENADYFKGSQSDEIIFSLLLEGSDRSGLFEAPD